MVVAGERAAPEESSSSEEETLISEHYPQAAAWRRGRLTAAAAVALLCAAACARYAVSRGASDALAAREVTRFDIMSAAKESPKPSSHGSKNDKPIKEQYCLAVMDFKGEENNDELSVKMGDVVRQLGDADDSGWVWAEKVADDGDGEADKSEAGYVPKWAVKLIPPGSGKDTAAILAKQKHGKDDH